MTNTTSTTGSSARNTSTAQEAAAATRASVMEASLEGRNAWSRLARFGLFPLLVGLDGLAVVLGVVGSKYFFDSVGVDIPAHKTAAFGLVLLLCLGQGGLYRSRLSLSVLDDVPVLVSRWLAAAALAVLGQLLWSQATWNDYIIQWRLLWGAVVILALIAVLRAAGYTLIRGLRARRLVAYRTAILGTGQVGQQIADILTEHPEYGLDPVGFIDVDPQPTGRSWASAVLDEPGRLASILQDWNVHSIVVAFSSAKESEMVRVIRTCDRMRCELFVVPRLFELHQVGRDMDNAWGLPLVRLRRSTYRSRAWRAKRLIDIVVSGLSLLFLLPLLVVLALAVRLDGGPGILFRQERVGVDGRQFQVLKFRSLRPVDETESATMWNISLDDRLSRIGRFLRKTSLDELPQLINVLKGDMSLVGPRPERPHFVDQFRSAYPSYDARHRVPSGLTGWAQVHGLRGNTSIADRARFDNYYIENWSLWLDVKIIILTIRAVLRASGG